LNNNRANNRRRGRGNNNRPQNGGQQLNRIDSRARGNAPQMLEKYRKLAQDAHMNGDRVQAEYYLQFADHYFRVIADARVRTEDTRARRDDRWQENGESPREETDDSGDFSVESDFPNFDTPPPVYTRREREDRPQDQRQYEPRQQDSRQQPEPRRREEQPSAPRSEAAEAPAQSGAAQSAPTAEENIYEPPQNPFLREGRGTRGLRPRRDDRRPRREDQPERAPRAEADVTDGSGLAASLPPAIASSSRKAAEVAAPSEEAPAPAPKRRAPRRKPVADAGDTPSETVG
jgi:hypothetical protein